MLGIALALALYVDQPTASDPLQAPDDIVVEGSREQRERARGFINKLTDNIPSFGQIGRFHSPVCPAAMGVPAAQSQQIAERMKRVAQAAGMTVGKAGCRPNVFLIAAVDKGSTIAALNESFPAYFSGMGNSEVRRLAASRDMAVAWQIKNLLSADGTELKKVAGGGYYINEGTNSGSRVRSGTMPAFVTSMVVVELSALKGLSVTQVADYAAMRAFADTDPLGARNAGAPTILTILEARDDQSIPLTLTQWDLAYLKSLYATSNAYYASYQRGDMAHELTKELSKSSGN